MTEQDKLREAIKRIDDYSGISREDVTRVARAAEQSLTFRRLPLPEELDEKALFAMFDATKSNMTKCGAMRAAYKALYEHLTKPKTKMVDVWRVEYVKRIPGTADDPCAITYLNRADAERRAAELPDFYCTCVRVTGPHQQEMPT